MNSNKILQIMPFVLAGLIVILITLIIIGGLENKSKDNDTQTDKLADAGNNIDPTSEPVDWKSDQEKNSANSNDNNSNLREDEPAITIGPVENKDPEPTDSPVDSENGDGGKSGNGSNTVADNEFGYKFTEKQDFIDTKNGVNLRAGCSTDTEIVAYLEIGKRLERTGYNDQWTRVIYNGMECYISTPLVVRVVSSIDEKLPEEQDDNNQNGTVTDNEFGFKFEAKSDYVDTKDDVNLRSGASTDTAVAAYLAKGKRLKRTGYNSEWTRVEYEGKTCYIATRLITKVSATATDENTEDQGTSDNNGNNSGNDGNTDNGNNTEDNGNTDNGNETGDNGNADNGNETGDNGNTDNGNETGDNGNNDNGNETGDNGNNDNGNETGDNGSTDGGNSDDANTDTNTDNENNGSTDNGNDDNNTGADDSGNSGNENTNTENETDNTGDNTGSTPASGGIFFGSGSGKLICIDPGHQTKGNYNTEPIAPGSSEKKPKVSSGTSGKATGTPEYKLNLNVALQLKDELVSRGYRVVMTRTTNDVDISNIERAAIANDNKVDAFIRVHANGNDNTSVSGIETICQTKNNKYNSNIYTECKKLSECVLDNMVESTGGKKRYVWETDTMSGINWSKVPVTIVEMGYMTNAEEDKKLSDASYQKKIVKGIADGVDEFFK